jgi:dihydrofolate reductase
MISNVKPKLSIIAALSKNRVIGKDNKIPWHLPLDMKHFKDLTTGHTLIMGRKTFESMGKPLPNRTNIVITRNQDYKPEGIVVVNSFSQALLKAQETEFNEIFIAGGGEIYAESINLVDRLYLTLIEKEIPGDTFFPEYSQFTKIISEEQLGENGLEFKFITLEK